MYLFIDIFLFSEVKLLPFKTLIFITSKIDPVDTNVGFENFKNTFIPLEFQPISLVLNYKRL